MATAASRRLSTGIAWSAFGVLALATFSILTTSSAAHAQEDSDGLFGAVTSVLSSTVSDVVEPVVDPVTDIVADAVPAVTEPVTDLLQDAPVSKITDPVLDIVADVPVVGDVLEGIGVTDAVDDVVGVVDSTTGLLGDTVEATVPPVLDAVHPVAPVDSEVPLAPVGPPAPEGSTTPVSPTAPAPALPGAEPIEEPPATKVPDVAIMATGTITAASAGTTASASAFDQLVATLVATSVDAESSGAPGLPNPSAEGRASLGSPAPSSSAGHGGSSVSDVTRFADGRRDSLHSWTQSLGTEDDDLPPSPVAEADVAPD